MVGQDCHIRHERHIRSYHHASLWRHHKARRWQLRPKFEQTDSLNTLLCLLFRALPRWPHMLFAVRDDALRRQTIKVRPRRAKIALSVVFLTWSACILYGLMLLWRYESTPGPERSPSVSWPAATSLALHDTLPTLVMFAHPRCPCTRASIAELTTLMTHHQGKVDARVYFFQPANPSPEWSHTDLIESVRAIPGVSVAFDTENAEARQFGAKTSGYTLLFNPAGQVLFSGGITAARGHIGDNVGRTALDSLLEGGRPQVAHTLVFGCQLEDLDRSEL